MLHPFLHSKFFYMSPLQMDSRVRAVLGYEMIRVRSDTHRSIASDSNCSFKWLTMVHNRLVSLVDFDSSPYYKLSLSIRWIIALNISIFAIEQYLCGMVTKKSPNS